LVRFVPIICVMHHRYKAPVAASACTVAGFLAVFARDDWPDFVYWAAYGALVMALVSLGAVWRIHALWAFALVYWAGCVIWQLFLWTDDAQLSGIDDIPPIGGYFVTAPVALVLVAIGWASAAVVDGLRDLLNRSSKGAPDS
jgi:hypothetical protein